MTNAPHTIDPNEWATLLRYQELQALRQELAPYAAVMSGGDRASEAMDSAFLDAFGRLAECPRDLRSWFKRLVAEHCMAVRTPLCEELSEAHTVLV